MLENVSSFLDPVFIAPYKAALALSGDALVAFILGTLALVAITTVIGELTMAGVYWLNRRHFASLRRDMITHNNLSLQALAQKDKVSFTACNRLANEFFGRNLFSGFTLFASSLWPAVFALAWMGSRFGAIVVPLWGLELRYPALFVPLYVLARIGFGLTKKRIWPFTRITAWISRNEDCGEKLMTISDLLPKEPDETGKTEKPGKAGDTPA
jgi:hypothetical protein